jgi:hypothetical protein
VRENDGNHSVAQGPPRVPPAVEQNVSCMNPGAPSGLSSRMETPLENTVSRHRVGACLMCGWCTSPGGGGGQPDMLSMAKKMAGEFGTFTVEVKDDVVDRVSERTSALTGRP